MVNGISITRLYIRLTCETYGADEIYSPICQRHTTVGDGEDVNVHLSGGVFCELPSFVN